MMIQASHAVVNVTVSSQETLKAFQEQLIIYGFKQCGGNTEDGKTIEHWGAGEALLRVTINPKALGVTESAAVTGIHLPVTPEGWDKIAQHNKENHAIVAVDPDNGLITMNLWPLPTLVLHRDSVSLAGKETSRVSGNTPSYILDHLVVNATGTENSGFRDVFPATLWNNRLKVAFNIVLQQLVGQEAPREQIEKLLKLQDSCSRTYAMPTAYPFGSFDIFDLTPIIMDHPVIMAQIHSPEQAEGSTNHLAFNIGATNPQKLVEAYFTTVAIVNNWYGQGAPFTKALFEILGGDFAGSKNPLLFLDSQIQEQFKRLRIEPSAFATCNAVPEHQQWHEIVVELLQFLSPLTPLYGQSFLPDGSTPLTMELNVRGLWCNQNLVGSGALNNLQVLSHPSQAQALRIIFGQQSSLSS